MARIFYADLFGPRDDKYNSLLENDLSTTHWTELSPQSPFYLFVPQNVDLMSEYEQGWKLSEIMPRTLLGPNSHRDGFAIASDYETAATRIRDFSNASLSDDAIRQRYDIVDNRDWSLQVARRAIPENAGPVKCIYRPFDFRFMLYGSYAFDYHRPEINDHLLGPNVGLVSTRQTKENFAVLAINKPAGQHKLATPYDGSYISPLYLYPNTDPRKQTLFDTDQLTITDTIQNPKSKIQNPGGRRPNLNPAFIADLEQRLGLTFVPDGKGDLLATFDPEDVFNYMYAIFHSPTYRSRYAEFLKIDFPRLPLTSDPALFRTLCALGEQLVGLHLMESRPPTAVSFPVRGSNKVERVQYTAPTASDPGRVHINKTQYFDNVPPEAWEFHIGGYQVAEKWLKDRKGRTLTLADMQRYQGVIVALLETGRIMGEIDAAIPGWPLG